jgi:hypothetical protein
MYSYNIYVSVTIITSDIFLVTRLYVTGPPDYVFPFLKTEAEPISET